jgi:hypothetical protein
VQQFYTGEQDGANRRQVGQKERRRDLLVAPPIYFLLFHLLARLKSCPVARREAF